MRDWAVLGTGRKLREDTLGFRGCCRGWIGGAVTRSATTG